MNPFRKMVDFIKTLNKLVLKECFFVCSTCNKIENNINFLAWKKNSGYLCFVTLGYTNIPHILIKGIECRKI